jgi:hypothetical protein
MWREDAKKSGVFWSASQNGPGKISSIYFGMSQIICDSCQLQTVTVALRGLMQMNYEFVVYIEMCCMTKKVDTFAKMPLNLATEPTVSFPFPFPFPVLPSKQHCLASSKT